MKKIICLALILILTIPVITLDSRGYRIANAAQWYIDSLGYGDVYVLDFNSNIANELDWDSNELSDYFPRVNVWGTLLSRLSDTAVFSFSNECKENILAYADNYVKYWVPRQGRNAYKDGKPSVIGVAPVLITTYKHYSPWPTVEYEYEKVEYKLKYIAAFGAYAYDKGIYIENGDDVKYANLLSEIKYETGSNEERMFYCLIIKTVDFILHNR